MPEFNHQKALRPGGVKQLGHMGKMCSLQGNSELWGMRINSSEHAKLSPAALKLKPALKETCLPNRAKIHLNELDLEQK